MRDREQGQEEGAEAFTPGVDCLCGEHYLSAHVTHERNTFASL